jgi:hypothetical protein
MRTRKYVAPMALVVGLLASASLAVIGQSRESADTVVDWNVYAERVLNQAAQERGQPQRVRLESAMVQGAVYDAVNAIAGTHEPYLVAPPALWWYSKDGAVATAAYRMLIAILPARAA